MKYLLDYDTFRIIKDFRKLGFSEEFDLNCVIKINKFVNKI